MRYKGLNKLIFFICIFFSCNDQGSNINKIIQGKVIAVKDGDTIELLYEGKPLVIRLEHIDCPEMRNSQPFGKASKQLTSELCFGKNVTIIHENGFDRFKRLIAVVVNDQNQNINQELVKAGLAWHFKKYSSDSTYAKLENEARAQKLGLWAEENPTPPWEWRRK